MDINSNSFLQKIQQAKSIVAVSNFDFSLDIENYIKNYDCIIRFNGGSNEVLLKSYGDIYNDKTDICVLSGYKRGNFGPIEAFKDKYILFSRPKMQPNLLYRLDRICISSEFLQKINKVTNHISFIPVEVFYSFIDKYKYFHPTSGLITLFYIKTYLKIEIDSINFCPDKKYFFNYFLNGIDPSCPHKPTLEKEIIKELKINNIYI